MCQIEPHIWDVSGGFADLKYVMKNNCEYSAEVSMCANLFEQNNGATSHINLRDFVSIEYYLRKYITCLPQKVLVRENTTWRIDKTVTVAL